MRVERQFGDNEKVTWILDQAAPMNFVIITQIEGPLDPLAIQTALEPLAQMHPFLKTCIEVRSGNPWVVTKEEIKPAFTVLKRLDDSHWHAKTEEELNAPFDKANGPLMRVTLLHSQNLSDLIITFYHSIGDGFSGIYVMRDLLTLAGNWQPGSIPSPLTIYEPRPSVERLLPVSAHGWPGFCKTVALMGKQIYNGMFEHPQKLPVQAVPRNMRKARIEHRVLPGEILDSLIFRSRENNTTVQGALCASLLFAMAEQMDKKDSVIFNCMSIVDQRRFLNPPIGEEIGMFATAITTAHRVHPAPEFWDLAREVKQKINQAMESGEPLVSMALTGQIVPKKGTIDEMADKISGLYSAATLVTNVGKLDLPETYGRLRVKKWHFTVALKALTGPEFNLATASFAGQMQLNFIYTSPHLPESDAARIADRTVSILKEYAINEDVSVNKSEKVG